MGPVVFVILDGWGVNREAAGNPLAQAYLPTIQRLHRTYPLTLLKAHGTDVGLPPNEDGNSEAGHLNLGAGRVVEQDNVYISHHVNDGTFFKNPSFLAAVRHAAKHRSRIHVMGLLTGQDSGHANLDHLIALLSLFRGKKVPRVFLHFFTDGRDTRPYAAVEYLERFQRILRPTEQIVTIMGRFYAMDRKKQWSRTLTAFTALVSGTGVTAPTPIEAVVRAYNRGETDEFIAPTIITTAALPPVVTRIRNRDSVIFFNLRSDRARQLTKAFVQKNFPERNPGSFPLAHRPKNILFVALTDFGPDLGDVLTAFPSRDIPQTLPFVFASSRQLYLTESEKFAQVTYFFNGGYTDPVAGEERLLVPSPNVRSYDRIPAMSGEKLTRIIVDRMARKQNDFIVVNYPNLDMIGHTGNFKAAVTAAEFLDRQIAILLKAVLKRKGLLLLTSDHGNVEEMVDVGTGAMDTQHSKHPVPLTIAGSKLPSRHLAHGRLADVAPTLLAAVGLPVPSVMTGKSLWRR